MGDASSTTAEVSVTTMDGFDSIGNGFCVDSNGNRTSYCNPLPEYSSSWEECAQICSTYSCQAISYSESWGCRVYFHTYAEAAAMVSLTWRSQDCYEQSGGAIVSGDGSSAAICYVRAVVTGSARRQLQPIIRPVALRAYWDSGICGPDGDDANAYICGNEAFNCPEEISFSDCASGKAVKSRELGTGLWKDSIDIDGCNYAYYTEYTCKATDNPTNYPTEHPSSRPTEHPTSSPTKVPTNIPSPRPTSLPTFRVSFNAATTLEATAFVVDQTSDPTLDPSYFMDPTSDPTVDSSYFMDPTSDPTVDSSYIMDPTADPTSDPTSISL